MTIMENKLFPNDVTRAFLPGNIFFTSDHHFCHENIIRFCNRPFDTVEQMNQELVRLWNETVPPDGIVFHLGDFCFGGAASWNHILDCLNGKIYLILGNHDMKNIKQGYMNRFEHVTQQMTIRIGSQVICLNHNPFLAYGGSYRDVWQLFGHVHSGPLSKLGKDMPRLEVLFPLQYDVGVDNNGFRPVSFEEVKAKIQEQVAAKEAINNAVPDNQDEYHYRETDTLDDLIMKYLHINDIYTRQSELAFADELEKTCSAITERIRTHYNKE